MRASLLKAVMLGILCTLVCPGPAQGDWDTVNTGFKVKNRHKTKTLTSWKIEMSGDGEFAGTSVTNGDGTPLTGFTAKITNPGGRVIVELTGGNLAPGGAQNIIVWFNGTRHSYPSVVKDYKEDERDDLSTVQERGNTVFTDSEVIYGGPEGRVFLGMLIPPATYGFFYQITNQDPVETVHTLSLNLGSASAEPYGFGVLPFPHDGVRETHEADEDGLIDREAKFEELGLEPGVFPLYWGYDPAGGQVIADFGGGIWPGQCSNVFYFFCDQTCNARSVPESELFMGSGPVTVQCLVPSLGGPWEEPFDVYEVGSSLHGQGRWKGWDNDPAFDAIVSDVQARSAPHSVEIAGSSDLVQEFEGFTAGKWQFTAWQYIPGDFSSNSGEPFAGTYFILLNNYADGGPHEECDWSVQMNFDSNDGMLKVYHGNGLNTVDVPYIPDEWVELQVVIDLDQDLTQIYYDDAFVVEYSWTGGVLGGGGGALNIGAVDLFANQSTSVFWDDLSIEPYVPECPGDLDGDADVDLSDLAQLLAHYGTPSGADYEDGDLDGDGDVDLSDLAALLAVYGTTCE
jgi:hypothetical protein